MSILEREIAALDGVVGAQVETIDGAPISVRLDLEEGIDPAEVAGAVQAVLRRHGLKSRVPGSEPEPVEAEPEPRPVEVEAPSPDRTTAIDAVVVRQGRAGVDVTVVDADGRSVEVACTSHPDEVARAVVDAVARLLGRRVPRLVERTTQEVGGRLAVTAVVDLGHGDLAVGTVFETGTAELALARAVWSALVG